MGDFLGYMEKARMIAQLRTSTHGIGALGKVDKVYLDNTNILYNLSDGREDIGTVRETFFFNQMRVGHEVLSSPVSDFLIEGKTFEVGGRRKGFDQLKGVTDDKRFRVLEPRLSAIPRRAAGRRGPPRCRAPAPGGRSAP